MQFVDGAQVDDALDELHDLRPLRFAAVPLVVPEGLSAAGRVGGLGSGAAVSFKASDAVFVAQVLRGRTQRRSIESAQLHLPQRESPR
jgi:hypothetical protein